MSQGIMDRTPLHVALEFGHESFIDLLARLTAEAEAAPPSMEEKKTTMEENNVYRELSTISTPITDQVTNDKELFSKLAFLPPVTPIKKGYAICPICNIQVKYPTAMSCIVDDQLSIDQRLHNNGDFLLTTATATIGGKKK